MFGDQRIIFIGLSPEEELPLNVTSDLGPRGNGLMHCLLRRPPGFDPHNQYSNGFPPLGWMVVGEKDDIALVGTSRIYLKNYTSHVIYDKRPSTRRGKNIMIARLPNLCSDHFQKSSQVPGWNQRIWQSSNHNSLLPGFELALLSWIAWLALFFFNSCGMISL